MTSNKPLSNYSFDKHGILLLLLPSNKQISRGIEFQGTGLKIPSDSCIDLIQQQQSAYHASALNGELLICSFFSKLHGSCIALFPALYKLGKRNISKATVLAFTDMETLHSNFYVSKEGTLKPLMLPLQKRKAVFKCFSPTIPYAIWIRPNIKTKLIIQGCYLNPTNIHELITIDRSVKEKAERSDTD